MSTQPEPAPAARSAKNAAAPISITHEAFVAATDKWRSILNKEQPHGEEAFVDLRDYFQVKDKTSGQLSLIAGYDFSLDSIEKLVSTVGIQTVMVRFGIVQDPDAQQNVFTAILYGFNSFQMRVTPYLVGKPYTVPYKAAGLEERNSDQLPDVLGNQWMGHWQSYAEVPALPTPAPPIKDILFNTIYGYLQGYNYRYSDFVDNLFPVSADPRASWLLRVNFGLHRYFQVDATSPEDVVNTFGLVLCLIEVMPGPAGQPAVGNGPTPYYDFSAPCPPTC
jgi:hypothetical protein